MEYNSLCKYGIFHKTTVPGKLFFSCLDHSGLGLTIIIKLLTSFLYGRLKNEDIGLNKKHIFT